MHPTNNQTRHICGISYTYIYMFIIQAANQNMIGNEISRRASRFARADGDVLWRRKPSFAVVVFGAAGLHNCGGTFTGQMWMGAVDKDAHGE